MNDDTNIQSDPSQEEGFDVGQGEGLDTGDMNEQDIANSSTEQDSAQDVEDKTLSPVDAISEKLSQGEAKDKKDGEKVAEPVNPIPFDLNSMSLEQRQQLKAMLAVTPDAQVNKRVNNTVTLRKIDGKIVEDFKNSYQGVVRDDEQNRDVVKPLIPVKLEGEDEYKTLLLSQFINAERVPCEVISKREDKREIKEGETISRKTKQPVEMVRTEVVTFFTIKLPNGDTREIEGRLANA